MKIWKFLYRELGLFGDFGIFILEIGDFWKFWNFYTGNRGFLKIYDLYLLIYFAKYPG